MPMSTRFAAVAAFTVLAIVAAVEPESAQGEHCLLHTKTQLHKSLIAESVQNDSKNASDAGAANASSNASDDGAEAAAAAPAPGEEEEMSSEAAAPAPAPGGEEANTTATKHNKGAKAAGAAVPPVSTTMKCIISVTVQYFIVWTALALVKIVQKIEVQKYALEGILEKATNTVKYAPMISILFLATRMRAVMLTKGDTETYGLPQWWCKDGMIVCAICVAVLTLINIAESSTSESSLVLVNFQYVAMAALYASYGVVSYGLYTMDTPQELGGSVRVSDTANCVMILTIAYFVIQILFQVSGTVDAMNKDSRASAEKSPFTKTTGAALDGLDLAPMICILFLASRMRALQMGLEAPQQWARIFFFIGTYGILLHAVLAATKAFNEGSKNLITILESIVMLAVYVAMGAVIVSVLTIEAPEGKETLPISTTVRIVMACTVSYFLVYALLFAFEELHKRNVLKSSATVTLFKAAKESVMFCPMLCILFVGTRMRALQITHNKGAPQGWVQDCMCLAVWGILIDLTTVIIEHMFETQDEKHVISAFGKNICFAFLYGGVVAVMVGLFYMTPENANGKGELIPGWKIPGRL